MNPSRVLVAVSSPWASEKLAKPISDMVRRLDASAVITHVAHTKDQDQNEADAKQRGEQTLDVLSEAMKQAGVDTEVVMLFADDIPKAIIKTATARNCTMIVLGLSGKNVLQRLLGGDVPVELLKQTQIPVLLCPAAWNGSI